MYVCLLKSFLQHFISECVLNSHKWLYSRVPLGGTWEHRALVWVGYKLWIWGNNLPCGVYYPKFLEFFPVWGEHPVNHEWLYTGEDVCQDIGHSSAETQLSTQGLPISTKLQNESQVQLYFSLHFLHTNSYSQCQQPSLRSSLFCSMHLLTYVHLHCLHHRLLLRLLCISSASLFIFLL